MTKVFWRLFPSFVAIPAVAMGLEWSIVHGYLHLIILNSVALAVWTYATFLVVNNLIREVQP